MSITSAAFRHASPRSSAPEADESRPLGTGGARRAKGTSRRKFRENCEMRSLQSPREVSGFLRGIKKKISKPFFGADAPTKAGVRPRPPAETAASCPTCGRPKII